MPRIIDIQFGANAELKRNLFGYLRETLTNAVNARKNQMDAKHKRWLDNYAAKPYEPIRTTPFYRASNFVPQLIRMHTDILTARLIGIVCSTKPFWMPKTLLGKLPHEYLESIGEWIEYKSMYEIELYEPLDMALFQTVKTGTLVMKGWFQTDETTLVNSVNETGITANGEVSLITEGMNVEPLAFDDFFVHPITARTLKQVQVKFHRLRLTKMEVEYRRDKGVWNKEAAESLLAGPDPESVNSPSRASSAQDAGLQITEDVARPFTAFECWLDYPLQSGKNYRIVVVINPRATGDKGILRAYYNPSSRGLDPFVDWRIMPREHNFYGHCIPEILEQAQEEQAQIHNARRDSNTIANMPGWKKRKYADGINPSAEWYPGKVFELEDMADLEPLQFGINYNSMIEEEQFLLSLAERYSGVGPPMQGAGAGSLDGKRGIYNSQGTMAMLSEGNRRLDIYIRRFRYPFHRLGNLIYQGYKDNRPQGDEYMAAGPGGELVQRSFKFQEPEGFKGLYFEIGASDASANQEIERSNLLLMANTMSGYYKQIIEAAAQVAQIPPEHPLREVMLQTLDGARDLANRLLFQFNVGDRARLVPNVRDVLGGGPPPAAQGALASGLPEATEPVSRDRMAALSGMLASVTRGNNPGNGNGQNSGGNVPPAGPV